MAKILHETEIECSDKLFNPFFGNDRARLIIYKNKLVFKKINTKMRIPQKILISDIKRVKLKLIWKLQLRIEILYKSKGKIEKFSFVSGGIIDKIAYQSIPFKTYKAYKIIKELYNSNLMRNSKSPSNSLRIFTLKNGVSLLSFA